MINFYFMTIDADVGAGEQTDAGEQMDAGKQRDGVVDSICKIIRNWFNFTSMIGKVQITSYYYKSIRN